MHAVDRDASQQRTPGHQGIEVERIMIAGEGGKAALIRQGEGAFGHVRT